MNKQMELFKCWQYEEDNATVMAKCPECERRMIIHLYTYENPYKFCPYCGQKLEEGALKKARRKVYALPHDMQ